MTSLLPCACLLAQSLPPPAAPSWAWMVPYLIGALIGGVPVAVFLLTRRAKQTDERQAVAVHAEQLFIGGSQELIKLLQAELTRATSRLAGAENERDRLRGEMHELTLVFESHKLQHRALTELMTRMHIELPRTDGDAPRAEAAP